MTKKEKIYEGKAKIIYSTDSSNLVIQSFKDSLTAFNAEKKGISKNKGLLCNKISSLIFLYLEESGIKTHFIRQLNDTEMLVYKLNMLPIEVVVRNFAAGSLSKRLGIKEGTELSSPVIEYYYKNDTLGDPLINASHIKCLDLVDTKKCLENITNIAEITNTFLQVLFSKAKITLVDFKLEFGFTCSNILKLADEISPDTCRLWDMNTGKKLDKDNFRFDLGDVKNTYLEIYDRLKLSHNDINHPLNEEFFLQQK